MKYFDMFFFNIAWILKVHKFPKHFGLHFKNSKIMFFVFLIHKIVNLYVKHIIGIK